MLKRFVKQKLLKNNRKVWHDFYWQLYFRYHSVFLGALIFNGKRMQAFAWFLDIKQGLKDKESFDPYFVFLIAMLKITPNLIFSILKLGGASYHAPLPISEHKRIVFGVKWTLKLLKDKYKNLTIPLIVDTLISSLYNKGISFEKKCLMHKLGSRNRHLLKFFK